jgi:tetratricopeptide (TPR) repeat protein
LSGEAKRLSNKLQEAIVDFDASLHLEPNSASALRCRGEAKRLSENYEEAIMDFDTSLRLAPNNAFAKQQRALAEIAFKEQHTAEFNSSLTKLITRANSSLSEAELRQLNEDFQQLEVCALTLKREDFFIARGEWFERIADDIHNNAQKSMLNQNALQDYQRALTLNCFSSLAGEKIKVLQQKMPSPSPAAAGLFANHRAIAAVNISHEQQAEFEGVKRQQRPNI